MDWIAILNATDARERVVNLLYLCRERYALDASEAGRQLALEDGGAACADELIAEARKYALPGSPALNQGSWIADDEAVRYLRDLVAAYETPHRLWSVQAAKRLWRRFRTRHWPGFDQLPKVTSAPTDNG